MKKNMLLAVIAALSVVCVQQKTFGMGGRRKPVMPDFYAHMYGADAKKVWQQHQKAKKLEEERKKFSKMKKGKISKYQYRMFMQHGNPIRRKHMKLENQTPEKRQKATPATEKKTYGIFSKAKSKIGSFNPFSRKKSK